MRYRKTSALLVLALALLLVFGAVGCAQSQTEQPEPTVQETAEPVVTPEPTPEATPEPTPEPPVLISFNFDEPKGFTQDGEDPMRLNAPKPKKDKSFITVRQEQGGTLPETEAAYTERLMNELTEQLGWEQTPEIAIESFETAEIDGLSGLRVTYTASNAEKKTVVRGLDRAALAGDTLYTVRFLDMTKKGTWGEDFAASAETMDFYWSDEIPTAEEMGLVDYAVCDGLTMYLPDGLIRQQVEGADGVFISDNFIVTAVRETFDTCREAGFDPDTLDMKAYTTLLKMGYDLENDFQDDGLGNLYTTYVRDIEGVNLLYFLTARKGADCFYIINFACPESTQDTYVPLFALWQLYIEAE